jgi:hypothetical protein
MPDACIVYYLCMKNDQLFKTIDYQHIKQNVAYVAFLVYF